MYTNRKMITFKWVSLAVNYTDHNRKILGNRYIHVHVKPVFLLHTGIFQLKCLVGPFRRDNVGHVFLVESLSSE